MTVSLFSTWTKKHVNQWKEGGILPFLDKMEHLGSDLQQQLQSARNELALKKQELQQYKEKIEVLKSGFCAQKCSISLRYLE